MRLTAAIDNIDSHQSTHSVLLMVRARHLGPINSLAGDSPAPQSGRRGEQATRETPPTDRQEDTTMQVILDFLLLVGSLVELLLYVALASVVLATTLLAGGIAVLTLRSPGSAVVIPDRRPSVSRQPRPAVKHQLARPVLVAVANEAILAKTA
jgi:hypothetical protein